MARVFGTLAVHTWNLADHMTWWPDNFHSFRDDVNVQFSDGIYEDVVRFGPYGQGIRIVTELLGSGITFSGDELVGGIVSGIRSYKWDGSTWKLAWHLEGLSLSAASIAEAMVTRDFWSLVKQLYTRADLFELSDFNDAADGAGGNDHLNGRGGDDSLGGGTGADILNGGMGQDRMNGGPGDDLFVFRSAPESAPGAYDIVEGFGRGQDRIDLQRMDADATASGNQAFVGFIGPSDEFTRPGQLKFSNGWLYGNIDEDADAEFVVLLAGVTSVDSASFIF